MLALTGSAATASVLAVLGASASGTIGGRYVVLGVAALGVAALTAYRPIAATYIYLALLPFLAGIERGALLPLVRPNEALLVLLLAGALVGGYVRFLRGESIPFGRDRLDASLVAFLVLATLWPITSMLLRGVQPVGADLAALLPICKQMAVLLLVRATVVSDIQMRRCLQLVVLPAAAVALIAVLQTLRFGPVLDLLETYWNAKTTSFDENVRGSTTLAHPIATGDYIIIGLILLVVGRLKGMFRSRYWLIPGALLTVGVFAAGQFSSWLAAGIAGAVLLWRFPEARRKAALLVPLAPYAAVLGAPAVLGRLADFQSGELPVSWRVRWDNVTHFYLPELTGHSILLGVSPNSVIEAPETWRQTIYLEAGYVQFLWIGGVPLLLAFLWLSREILRQAGQSRDLPGPYGVCCAGLEVIWWIVLVLTVLDPHLFLRGVGDLLFILIAISTRRAHEREHYSQVVPG
ncbi:hypothetical protein [Pseudonocardia hierapolitana]|uniref:hypothetical protein n=1 Tax=Pseudonocardia hierapolitana TaxID=1128676 RepID=UPI0011BEFADA|nr:hypothetical protein [Pseudonocardia hierapolitana]